VLDQHLHELELKLAMIEAHENAGGVAHAPGARFVRGFGRAMIGAASEYIRSHRRELAKGGEKVTNRSTRQARARSKAAQVVSRN
jgi:hypothetical protein